MAALGDKDTEYKNVLAERVNTIAALHHGHNNRNYNNVIRDIVVYSLGTRRHLR
jgi:hypothetical protein